MDDKSKEIIKKLLNKWGNIRLGKEHLKEIRETIADATGHNRFASFKNVRKWVSQVKKDMKKEAPKKDKRKAEPAEAVQSAPAISDRVFMQTIAYEIGGIRRSMDRINKQLDEIESKISEKK